MSSTNRGRERNRDDFYATPEWVTRAVLPFLVGESCDALDPCCGDGAILDALRASGATTTFGIELDEERAAEAGSKGHHVTCEDALAASWPAVPLIITNPPFSLAQRFIDRALEAARPRGTVAMLLRLAYLESAGRAPFHIANPSDVYVLANRPSFTADGATDSCAYAWFVWGPGRGGRIRVLDNIDPRRRSGRKGRT